MMSDLHAVNGARLMKGRVNFCFWGIWAVLLIQCGGLSLWMVAQAKATHAAAAYMEGLARAGKDTAPESEKTVRFSFRSRVLGEERQVRVQMTTGQAADFFARMDNRLRLAFFAGMGITAATVLCFCVLALVFVNACWKALPPERRTTTPLKASLLLLVPIFNMYWVHVALYGYARAANKLLSQRGQQPLISERAAVCLSPCAFLTLLPFVGTNFSFILLLLLCAFFVRAYRSVLALAQAPSSPPVVGGESAFIGAAQAVCADPTDERTGNVRWLHAYFAVILVLAAAVVVGFFWSKGDMAEIARVAQEAAAQSLSTIPPSAMGELWGTQFFMLTLLLFGAVFLRFVYRCWSLLPPDRRATTPGKAAWLLVVPFYNLFWIDVAFYGFVKTANAVLAERGISPGVSEKLTRAMAPCAFLTLVNGIGEFCFYAFAFLLCGFVSQAYSLALALACTAREKSASSLGC